MSAEVVPLPVPTSLLSVFSCWERN